MPGSDLVNKNRNENILSALVASVIPVTLPLPRRHPRAEPPAGKPRWPFSVRHPGTDPVRRPAGQRLVRPAKQLLIKPLALHPEQGWNASRGSSAPSPRGPGQRFEMGKRWKRWAGWAPRRNLPEVAGRSPVGSGARTEVIRVTPRGPQPPCGDICQRFRMSRAL